MCDIFATARLALAILDPLLSLRSGGLFHGHMPHKTRKTYIRPDDGAEMIEIAAHVYVEREWAESQGLLR